MITITQILGTASDPSLADRLHHLEHDDRVETLVVGEEDSLRRRLRGKTDKGTDVAIALERGGVCVTLGVSASSEVTFDARTFFATGRTQLYGFYLFTELGNEPAAIGLRRLADLVAAGQLAPHISVERPWSDIAQVAADLIARKYPGKAVLTLG